MRIILRRVAYSTAMIMTDISATMTSIRGTTRVFLHTRNVEETERVPTTLSLGRLPGLEAEAEVDARWLTATKCIRDFKTATRPDLVFYASSPMISHG